MNIKFDNKKVARYLRAKQITYAILGDKTGLNESSLRKKVAGERPMRIDEWQKIIRAYPSLRYYEKKE
jgi:hypothetical protein